MFSSQDSMDNITLFSIITVMSFFLLAPVAVFMEGVKFTPAYLQSAVSNLMVKIYTIVVTIATVKIYNCVEFASINAHFLTGIKC